jgi:hypothetical protein
VDESGDRVYPCPKNDVPEGSTAAGDQLDPFHYVQQQMFDAFDVGDRLREGSGSASENAAYEDDSAEDMDKLEEMYRQASQPVYGGKNVSIVSAIIVIINMSVIHGVSNVFVDELLTFLSMILLPEGNCLPSTHYEAKKLIRRLGMNYDIIHAYPSGCVLFWGQYRDFKECPVRMCRKSRYIQGSNSVPAKVIRHFPLIPRLFPLIPRLLRMYRSPAIAKLLKLHTKHALKSLMSRV